MIPSQLCRPVVAVFVAGAVLLAAGCSPQRVSQPAPDRPGEGPVAPSLEGLALAPSAEHWRPLESRAALMQVPDSRGQTVSLRERRSPQGRAQEIAWPMHGGTGRNLLTIAVHGTAARPDLSPAKPSEAGIKAEITEAFPSDRLTIVQEPRRNAYGPYGLAVLAHGDGMRCVYAWQWLDIDDRRVRAALGGSASWRARICSRSETLDEIATALDHMTVGAPSSITGAPKAAASAGTPRRPPAKASHPSLAREPAPAPTGYSQGGQRFLAAVSASPSHPSGETVLKTAFDRTLPAEAYRGPGSRQIPQSATPVGGAAMPRRAVPTPDLIGTTVP